MVTPLLVNAFRSFPQHLSLAVLVIGLKFPVRDQIAPTWLRLSFRPGEQRFQLFLVRRRIISPGSKLEILYFDSLLRRCKTYRQQEQNAA